MKFNYCSSAIDRLTRYARENADSDAPISSMMYANQTKDFSEDSLFSGKMFHPMRLSIHAKNNAAILKRSDGKIERKIPFDKKLQEKLSKKEPFYCVSIHKKSMYLLLLTKWDAPENQDEIVVECIMSDEYSINTKDCEVFFEKLQNDHTISLNNILKETNVIMTMLETCIFRLKTFTHLLAKKISPTPIALYMAKEEEYIDSKKSLFTNKSSEPMTMHIDAERRKAMITSVHHSNQNTFFPITEGFIEKLNNEIPFYCVRIQEDSIALCLFENIILKKNKSTEFTLQFTKSDECQFTNDDGSSNKKGLESFMKKLRYHSLPLDWVARKLDLIRKSESLIIEQSNIVLEEEEDIDHDPLDLLSSGKSRNRTAQAKRNA